MAVSRVVGSGPPERLRAAWFQGLGAEIGPKQVAFVAATQGEALIAQLDDGYAHRQGGEGGWEDIGRPGRPPASHFVGASSPTLLRIGIILGHWEAGWTKSIHEEMQLLERMARQPANAARGEHPPLLKVQGPVRHGGFTWVIDNDGLQWGEDTVTVAGNVVRTRALVVLRRYIEPDLVVIDQKRRRKSEQTRVYVVKRGETLTEIVRDELHAKGSRDVNAAKKRVLKLNDMRDPNQVKAGTRLRLPR